MPVVINEFEVTPEPPEPAKPSAAEKPEEKGDSQKPPMTDFEVKKMLERGLKRLERVSAH